MKPMNDADVTAKRLRRYATSEANPHDLLLLLLDVNGVDEADARRIALHHDRAGPGAVAEEAHAAHQAAVGHAGGGEDDAVARRQILRSIDPLRVGDPHLAAALFVL